MTDREYSTEVVHKDGENTAMFASLHPRWSGQGPWVGQDCQFKYTFDSDPLLFPFPIGISSKLSFRALAREFNRCTMPESYPAAVCAVSTGLSYAQGGGRTVFREARWRVIREEFSHEVNPDASQYTPILRQGLDQAFR